MASKASSVWLGCSSALGLSLALALIIISALKLKACPAEPNLPRLIIAYGSLCLVAILLDVMLHLVEEPPRILRKLKHLLRFVILVMTFVIVAILYQMWEPVYRNKNSSFYCDKIFYTFSFVVITIIMVVFILAMVTLICLIFMASFIAEDEEAEPPHVINIIQPQTLIRMTKLTPIGPNPTNEPRPSINIVSVERRTPIEPIVTPHIESNWM